MLTWPNTGADPPRQTPNLSKKNEVDVVNSAGRRIARTSRKNAADSVGRGCARWRGNAVEMIEADYRVMPVSVKRYRDGAGIAPLAAIEGLPCIQPVKLLTGKRPAEIPKDWAADAVVSRAYLPLSECIARLQQRSFPKRVGIPRGVRVLVQNGVRLTA